MSGKAIDYATTPVSFYKLVCNNPEIKSTYVGHTTNFIKKKADHKMRCFNENNNNYHLKIYQTIRANGGWSEFRMIEIEKRIVKDKRKSERIETDFMEQLQSDMNMCKSHCGFETVEEYRKIYYQEHRDELVLKKKIYNQEHRDELALKKKKEGTCECGSITRKGDLAQHKKSQKHKNSMARKG